MPGCACSLRQQHMQPAAAAQGRLWPSAQSHRAPSCRQPVRSGLLGLFGGGSNATAPPPPLEDEAGRRLQDWLTTRGLPAQKLRAAQLEGSGRGLVAASSISKGEPLLRVPAPLLVTPEAAVAQSPLLQRLLERQPLLPAWTVLAVALLEARAEGEAHPWAPYLAVLPATTGGVLEWSEAEVGWLRGSQLLEAAAQIRSAAAASWTQLQPLAVAAEAAGEAPAGMLTSPAARTWAFSKLLSRLVRLSGLGGVEVLVPWADLLNHSCSATTYLDWDPAQEAVVLRADQAYRPGQQVVASYGAKTSGELLLSYGFLPDPGSNPHDACQLQMQLPNSSARGGSGGSDAAAGWKAAALAAHGFGPSQLFPLRMGAVPWGLPHYAAFAAAEVGSAAEAQELAAALFGQDRMPAGMQRAALEAVVRRCQDALKGYPSSLEVQRAELGELESLIRASSIASGEPGQQQQQQQSGGSSEERQRQRRRRDVLRVLVYERQVLHRMVFLLQQELRDVKRLHL